MDEAHPLPAKWAEAPPRNSGLWEEGRREPTPRAWFHYPLNAFLFHALRLTLRLFPREAISRVRIPFADLYFLLARRDREALVSNIQHILGGEARRSEAVELARNAFRRYAQYLIDLICSSRMSRQELRSLISGVSNQEAILKALEGGKGAILLTAHLGNWELGGMILKAMDLPVHIVYYPDRIRGVERSRRRYRKRTGVGQVVVGESPFAPISMIQALRRNEIVCLQGDRNYGKRGIKVNFFGHPVAFPPGPVLLAMASGAPLIPIFILQEEGKGYRFLIEDPVPMQDTGDRDQDLRCNLERVVRVLERYLRSYQDQWFNFTRCFED
jgi:lauroyl/myristoyl acyltransferase